MEHEVDYGHWAITKPVDIRKYLGFTYLVEFTNGKKYIGAKKIWRRIKQSPSEFKRGPRKGFEQSDWRTYMSSSNDIAGMILDGIEIKRMVITGWYKNWGTTLYAEAVQQITNRVLSKNDWLNYQIEGHFVKGCDDESVETAVQTLSDVLSNSVDLYRTTMKIPALNMLVNENGIKVADLSKGILTTLDRLNITFDEFKKLINGDIHNIDDRIWLPLENRIVTNVVKHVPTNTEYRIFKDAQTEHNMTKKEITESSDFIMLSPETKAKFKERLSNEFAYTFELEVI